MNPRLVVLLVLLVAIGALFVGPVRSYRSSERHLGAARRELAAAEAQHAALVARRQELERRPALVREARRQGWIFPGETPFSVDAP